MKTIQVSDETYDLIKDQLGEDEQIEINSYDDFIGKNIFVRTVTYHFVGKVKKIVGNLVFLENASWVADSKRFGDAIIKGLNNEAEIEYLGVWFFNIQTVTDGGLYLHSLTNKQQ